MFHSLGGFYNTVKSLSLSRFHNAPKSKPGCVFHIRSNAPGIGLKFCKQRLNMVIKIFLQMAENMT